jgi:IS30 family transposase
MRTTSEADAMFELKRRGWSTRGIAAELGADRKTVRRYLRAGRWPGYKPRECKMTLASQAHIASQIATIQQQKGGSRSDPQDTLKSRKHAESDAFQW